MNLRQLNMSLSRRSIVGGALSVGVGVFAAPVRSVEAQDASPKVCTASSVEENETLVRRFYEEVWNNANIDLVGQLFADEFGRHYGNRLDEGGFDIPALTARIRERRLVVFPDFQVMVEDLFGEGDLVVARTYWTGTHSADLNHPDLETAATGIQIGYSGIALFRIACGKIAEQWIVNDELGLMQQIGAVPMVDEPSTPVAPPVGTAVSPETCQETTPAENKRLVTRVHEEALNGGNLALIDEIHTEDHRYHGDHRRAGDDPVASDDVVAAIYAEWLTDFPDRHATIELMVAKGDRVAAIWFATGTLWGDFEQAGIAGTGQRVSFSAVEIYRIACGQIAETWLNWDALSVYRQLTADSAATPTS